MKKNLLKIRIPVILASLIFVSLPLQMVSCVTNKESKPNSESEKPPVNNEGIVQELVVIQAQNKRLKLPIFQKVRWLLQKKC